MVKTFGDFLVRGDWSLFFFVKPCLSGAVDALILAHLSPNEALF